MPGAKVTLTNEATRFTLETTTSSDGSYSFTPIKIGNYTVSVKARVSGLYRKRTSRFMLTTR